MAYTAELLSVGTELLLGNILNSDARDLSRELAAMGINVYYHTVVGDNPQRLRAAVELADSAALILTAEIWEISLAIFSVIFSAAAVPDPEAAL